MRFLNRKQLATLKPGDRVYIESDSNPHFTQGLTITEITRTRIHCGDLLFSKITGAQFAAPVNYIAATKPRRKST